MKKVTEKTSVFVDCGLVIVAALLSVGVGAQYDLGGASGYIVVALLALFALYFLYIFLAFIFKLPYPVLYPIWPW